MRALLVLCLVSLVLAGCADDGPGPASSTTTTAGTTHGGTAGGTVGATTHTVDISGFAFAPSSLTVQVGDTVVWTNHDTATHTVDSTDGGPLASDNLGNGGTYSFTFDAAGTYAYRCGLHGSMTGSVTVQS